MAVGVRGLIVVVEGRVGGGLGRRGFLADLGGRSEFA